ncbi:MAG: hypothetical protein QOE44_1573, partial [Solirubrobacteraceae bacterium]|nr:hypothetical protein [Solirubrobacteraceae bacterium]
ALGLLDATQGDYNEQQALLDLSQGARVSRVAYQPQAAPPLRVTPDGRVLGWPAVRARAARARAEIQPGLLAGAIPGGAAYAGVGGRVAPEAVAAADPAGRVAAVSLGAARTLAVRTGRLLARFRAVVVVVPDARRLDALLARRSPGELVLVLERLPPTAPAVQQPPRLLAIGASGLPGGGTLGSQTTRRPGLVTDIDVAPTVLRWIGARVPGAVRGQPLTAAGRRDPAGLGRYRSRLGVIAGRRWPTVGAFFLAWLLLILAGAAFGTGGARRALRLGGLGSLWTPCTVLAAAALRPSRAVEVAVVVGGALLLAVATDRLVDWPHGPAVPAAATVLVYGVDLALGSPLISVSLLGSNPIAGGRFFGVGNELEAALPIVLFAGLAAGLPQRAARARDATIFAAAGLCLTAIAASGRLGADVGAVFTIGGGTAAGTLMLRPRPSRRAVAAACAVPFVGLAVLAGVDLATGAGGHFTGTVLQAGSAGDVADTFRRKLEAAFRELRKGVMPIDTAVCLVAGAYAIRRRDRVLGPVGDRPAWRALLIGGFAAGVVGSLTNDSGPVLLVVACFGLGCVIAYVHGAPRTGPPPAARDRASYPALQRT